MQSLNRIPLALLALTAMASTKPHAWQTGKLLDANVSGLYGGSTSSTTQIAGTDSSTTSQRAIYRVDETMIIDGGQYVYVVARVLKWRWTKESAVTVNAPIQFAIEGKDIYVLDEDGKEHKTKIIKRILKESRP
jgi:hypothetical protein